MSQAALLWGFPERRTIEQASLPAVLDADDTVARCQQGDSQAFRDLFLQHRADVARLVFRLGGSRSEVEDLVQEVFLQVHRSLKDFRGKAKFTTWLHRVTVNVVLMHRRAARCRPQLAEFQHEEDSPDERATGPDEDVERRERLRAFRRLLDELPEKKRTVFILHELEGLSPTEISKIVSAPVLTVRTRLFYARRALTSRMRSEPALATFVEQLGHEGTGEALTDVLAMGATGRERPTEPPRTAKTAEGVR